MHTLLVKFLALLIPAIILFFGTMLVDFWWNGTKTEIEKVSSYFIIAPLLLFSFFLTIYLIIPLCLLSLDKLLCFLERRINRDDI